MNHLVIITSVINISENPLTDSEVRSLFHNKRRQHDTLRTIYSIKEFLPTSKIFLVECSKMSVQQEKFLSDKVDYFINLFNDNETLKKVDSHSKSWGEGALTIEALNYIEKNNITYDSIIKISGRYWFNNDFNKSVFDDTTLSVFCRSDENMISNIYKLSKENVSDWKQFLIENEETYKNESKFHTVLTTFVNKIEDKCVNDNIGINGFSSSNGNYCNL